MNLKGGANLLSLHAKGVQGGPALGPLLKSLHRGIKGSRPKDTSPPLPSATEYEGDTPLYLGDINIMYCVNLLSYHIIIEDRTEYLVTFAYKYEMLREHGQVIAGVKPSVGSFSRWCPDARRAPHVALHPTPPTLPTRHL